MKFIFIHGGPGLNSNPEKNLLLPAFNKRGHEITFWNEPTKFNSSNYYLEIQEHLKNFVQSLGPEIHLIGHSFGATLAIDVAAKLSSQIASICLISPVVDLKHTDEQIFRVGLHLLKEAKSPLADRLEVLIPQLNDQFDSNKIEALSIGFQSGFFAKYFINFENFQNYFQYLQNENTFRLDDYLKIRSSTKEVLPSAKPNDGKAIAFYGANDPIVSYEHESISVKNYLPEVQNVQLTNMGHYPHIEMQEQFMEQLLAFCKG